MYGWILGIINQIRAYRQTSPTEQNPTSFYNSNFEIFTWVFAQQVTNMTLLQIYIAPWVIILSESAL